MTFWHAMLCGLTVVSGLAALYGLHRLGLWLEQRGWLFYKHKKPTSSAASCFVALQQMLEPPIQHVLHVKEEKRHQAEEGVPGQGDKPITGDDPPGTPGGNSSIKERMLNAGSLATGHSA